MVWTYSHNANHWTKDIVSIDGLDKPGRPGRRVHSIHLSGFAETLFGGMKPGCYSQILCLCANSLPSVCKIVARISQSVFVLLRPGFFSVRYFMTSK